MIQYIRGLCGERDLVAFDGFDDRFDGLFAKLFCTFLWPFGKQFCGPTLGTTFSFARFNRVE